MAYTTIDNPELYFQTKIYTGNGANNRAITFDGDENMQPDWLWIKNRSEAQSHALFDSVRGATLRFGTNSSGSESTENTNLDSFDTNGFTVDNELIVNGSSDLMVAWAWKAGGSASSNSNGSITSSVSASTTAGFSIVSYTGGGGGKTVGHSLGVAPKMFIIKARDTGDYNWSVWHSSLSTPTTARLALNTTAAQANNSSFWNDAVPTSTLFSLGSDGTHNANGTTYIAYCFAEKKGFSKFENYTGNGNADGPFIFTGFKPAFVMIKNTSTGSTNWTICDNKRDGFNDNNHRVFPNLNDAESTSNPWEMYSNGFKMTTTGSFVNASGSNYIYMAFAESPFVNSKGVPTTAR